MALLLSSWAIAEPIYKWKDNRGVVHFSTTPPQQQTNTETIAKPEPQKISNGASQMTQNKEDSEAVVKKPAEAPIDELQQKTEEEPVVCNSLRSNLAILKNGPPVRIKNKNGEYEILDNSGRQEEIARINKLMNEFCK
ncbi:DUF4124 domain-containing protein [Endozoicomonas sp. YOMI1]|uniref:DUF4124 domain-containing protein n=1 Tax=Endozoicomonas sp. YOMI1 TaxID=2828739 RepID=UPI002147C571|nr:DUF4124 domain-containing protein [Endozoicomonas sp. YOMI1]